MNKNFIDLDHFTKKQLREILSFAQKLKKNPFKYSSLLKSKSLGLLFQKQSTRTRLSFNIGMQKLGGLVTEINDDQIGIDKRESFEDILNVMAQYLDCLMIRNNDHKLLIKLGSLNILPIINGLSNYSHPCQILSDIFTIEESIGKIENKSVAWMGDFNNVLVSLIHASEIFKFKLNIMVPESIYKRKKNTMGKKKLKYSKFYKEISLGIKNVDCIMTDTWISMGEKNFYKKKQLFKHYQVNDKILSQAKKNAIFMHCLPAHRNEEVTDSVIDGKQSLVHEQAKNRMYVQQSILNYLINNVKN